MNEEPVAALAWRLVTLSLVAIGGGNTILPALHHFVVETHGWLTGSEFAELYAIAQAAPGPNVLFVALMGWNVGLNAGGFALAALGLVITMVGILLPSCTLTYLASQWGHRNRELRGVRAFKQGMAPIVVALLVATGWVLATGAQPRLRDAPLWAVAFVAAIIVGRTRIHLLWLLGAGALLGWFGLV
jgi:chromate transporter